MLLAILAGVGAFRVAALALNGTDLYVDEAQYWVWAHEPALGYYSKPPLIAGVIAGTTSVCGDGEFCVRLPSVFIHLATSIVVFLLGRRLYSEQAGFWSALVWATLPAVSLSSGIISTDVPLLFAWALALLAFAGLLERPGLGTALLLGLALGLGLNAKYAMAYFVPCAALFFLIAPEKLPLLRRPHLWMALALGFLLILPNILWNSANGYPTFAHTAENANWGNLPNPLKAVEFFVVQFGVLGPILFGTLIAIVWRARRRFASLMSADRLLLAFSVPIILAVTLQAFLSRAHANWAASAYVAATVLVTGVMLRDAAWRWLWASLGLHAVIAVAVAVATWQAPRMALPFAGNPFSRTLGNREVAAAVRQAVNAASEAGRPYRAIVTGERETAAAVLYYARDDGLPPLFAWRDRERPRDHFQLTRPFTARTEGPVLFVSRLPLDKAVADQFRVAIPESQRTIAAGAGAIRTLNLAALDGFRGR